jgi:predicted Zn-dependent protease with MMP-like domain
MNAHLREYFDNHLEKVLAVLPSAAVRLLDEVPLVVEDHPAREVMQKLGVRYRGQLCGLYTGIPLNRRSIGHSGILSDVIHLFREGVLGLATDRYGRIYEAELRKQIRITILHELGHHHGLTEEELVELGY